MTRKVFITGTDTNVGKTIATVALMDSLQQQGKTVLALKPMASDSFYKNGVLYNQDALKLKQNCLLAPDYNEVNPYRYKPPVSPHLVNKYINSGDIANHCERVIAKYQPDYCLIEGAGGWLCPLNQDENFSAIASKLKAEIILVVAIKLGCLNHSLLTEQAISSSGLSTKGWIANFTENSDIQNMNNSNISYLRNKLNSNLIGIINYNPASEKIITNFDIT